MNVTALNPGLASITNRASQAPAQAAAPAEQAPADRVSIGEQPAPGPDWRQSVTVQSAIWTGVAAASAVLGAVAGPQAGLFGGGLVGAAVGVVATAPDRSLLDKAGSALWGFFVGHAAGVIGSASIIGGSVVSAITGVGTGWALSRCNAGQ